MNSPITFPPFEPKLKLPRRASEGAPVDIAAESRRLQEEAGAQREREAQVFQNEERLRELEAQLLAAAGGAQPRHEGVSESAAPFYHRPGCTEHAESELVLQTGWEQLKRARALLEAEQRELRDQRLALRELEVQVTRREAAATAREHTLAQREARVAAAEAAQVPEPAESESVMARMTRAPFGIARSVFGGGNAK